jgi:hypothetical protein
MILRSAEKEGPDCNGDREFFDIVLTPSDVESSHLNACNHRDKHSTVAGVHYTNVVAYVHGALDFAESNKVNKASQFKNPRVEVIHNCAADSTAAAYVVLNVEPNQPRTFKVPHNFRVASFYNLTAERHNKTIQAQLADIIGVDLDVLFPPPQTQSFGFRRTRKFGDF